jgi:hypothetical protein
MIQLDRPVVAVRKLLRQLRRPHLLATDPLALRLRETLNAGTCREAIELLVDQTFAGGAAAERLREILVRCDLQGQKATAAAGGMHLSLRQFFRCRADAMEALAIAIEQIDRRATGSLQRGSAPHCALCHQPIVEKRQMRMEETS